MSTDARIIERIQKLLALAASPNEHEAASAAAKAQALMLEHDLAMDQVETKVDKRVAGIGQTYHHLRQRGKPGNWKIALYAAVAKTSDCWVTVGSTSGSMIGRKIDIELAEYLFAYLVATLERLQKEYGDTQWAALREYATYHGISTHTAEMHYSARGNHPLRMKDSWIRGASEAVESSLYQFKRDRDRAPAANALVVSKTATIRDWWAQQQGYADYADYQRAAKEQAANRPPAPEPTAKDLAEAEKAWKREERRQRKERERLEARTNWGAYYQGHEDGGKIAIREGVGGGSAPADPALID